MRILFLDPNDFLYGKIVEFYLSEKYGYGYITVYHYEQEMVWRSLYSNREYSQNKLKSLISQGKCVEITEENKEKWEKLIPFI